MTNVYFQRENFILCQLYFKDIAFVKSKYCERKKERTEERNKERKETEEGPAVSIELYVRGVWSEGYCLYSSDSQPSARLSVRDPSWPNHHPPPTPAEDKLELVRRPQRTWMGLRGRLAQTASPRAPSLSPGASAFRGWETWVCSPC